MYRGEKERERAEKTSEEERKGAARKHEEYVASVHM